MILSPLTRLMLGSSLIAGAAMAPVAPAFAQEAAPQPPGPAAALSAEPEDEPVARSPSDIVVTAPTLPGSVITDVPPDEVLDEAAIASYGASNLSELVQQLAVQTRGGSGRPSGPPVILLNGRRISGFNEVRNLPPEAIQRVEVFPQEVALEYGYAADQRVINFILRPRFSSVIGEVEGGGATQGGYWTYELEASLLRLQGRSRLNLTANYDAGSALRERERDIIDDRTVPLSLLGAVTPAGGAAAIDPALSTLAGRPVTLTGVPIGGGTLAQFAALADRVDAIEDGSRTLIAPTSTWTIDGSFAMPLGPQGGVSLTMNYAETATDQTLGLSPVSLLVPAGTPGSPFSQPVTVTRVLDGTPLMSDSRNQTFSAGASADGRLNRWRWSLSGSVTHADSNTVIDRGIDRAALQAAINSGANPFVAQIATTTLAPDLVQSQSTTIDSDLVLSGPLHQLPAGPVRATLQTGLRRIDFSSETQRSGVMTLTDLGRTAWLGSANIDIPIASRNDNVLAFLGDLSVNAQYRVRDVSDFSALTAYTLGFNWSPIDRVSLVASWVGDENAPSVTQLGAPVQVTPLRVVYDFTRGETVLATVTTGGNPGLLAETRRDFRAQANWQPIENVELNLFASYARTRSSNTTASLPLLTAEIEAAFPGRVVRGGDGRIVSVDQRPVNFAATRGRQIRYGISFARTFGIPQRPPGGGGMFGMGRPPAPPPAAPGAAPSAGAAGAAGAATPSPPPATGAAPAAPAAPQAAAAPAAPPAASAPRPPMPGGGPMGGRPPGAGGPGGGRGPGSGGGGGFGAMFGGGFGGRWDVFLTHTVRLQDEVLIRPGVPVLDLLDGSATGENGGSPEHEVELSGGRFFRGVGFRLSGTWRAPTRVDGSAIPGGGFSDDLRFGDQLLVNARMFVDLGSQQALTRAVPFFRGMRLRFAIDNVFNDIRTVRDESGVVPIRYQPGYVDPLGRTFEISLRKAF